MTWQEIRQRHPHSWVLVEALDAFTENGQRIIPDLRLIEAFGENWDSAWERYKQVHRR